MKLTKRKGFNFFRSYYDVYNELESDSDKVAFIDALFDRQFLGIKPTELKGMAKFAYISQTNSIDSQVKGYEDKTKTRLDGTPFVKIIPPPAEPPAQGVEKTILTPAIQEKEEVKEEVKEKVITINNKKFIETSFKDLQWLESIQRNNKVNIDVIKLFMTTFENHLITMEEQKRDVKSFKSHFVHWLNKQNLSQFRVKKIGKTNQV